MKWKQGTLHYWQFDHTYRLKTTQSCWNTWHANYNSMEQSPSWEANMISATQEIPCNLWNLEAHYHNHKSPPPVPILKPDQSSSYPHPTSWRFILILYSHLCLGLQSDITHVWYYYICVCLFSWRYNSLWLHFYSPVAGFSLLVFEVSWSHTTTRYSR
jgi:hypothetical protein